jgi:DNA primase catalytic subunit
MLEPWWIRRFYVNAGINVPSLWKLAGSISGLKLLGGRFVKLNGFRSRLSLRELRDLCVKLAPLHVYFSVLDWLFPERVGKKCKAKYAIPVGGEYVVDVDSYVFKHPHRHVRVGSSGVCHEYLRISKALTVQACEAIEEYYTDIAIVFSGGRGFHIHALGFNIHDWTTYNERNPIKSHEAARFKFSRTIDLETYVFDRHHFILSVDPMRVISVPNSLNAETGLKCLYIGGRKDLENMTINSLLYYANPALEIYGYPEPHGAVK